MPGILDSKGILSRVPYQGLPTFWRAEHTQDLTGADFAVFGLTGFCVSFSGFLGRRLACQPLRAPHKDCSRLLQIEIYRDCNLPKTYR